MAEMTSLQRAACNAEFMRELSAIRSAIGGALTKAELRAAVDALDTFLNDNAAAINNAIPQPARGVLTTDQKARLLRAVIGARYLNGV